MVLSFDMTHLLCLFVVKTMTKLVVSDHMKSFSKRNGTQWKIERIIKGQKFSLADFFLHVMKETHTTMDIAWSDYAESYIKVVNPQLDVKGFQNPLCEIINGVQWSHFLAYLGVKELQLTLTTTNEDPVVDHDQNAQGIEVAQVALPTPTEQQINMPSVLLYMQSQWMSWNDDTKSAALQQIKFNDFPVEVQALILNCLTTGPSQGAL